MCALPRRIYVGFVRDVWTDDSASKELPPMALDRVAELVRRAARDAGVFHALKNDPARLRSALDLTGEDLDALNGATAFPVPSGGTKASKTKDKSFIKPLATGRRAAAADPRFAVSELPGSGGSLLPPEGSGQFT